MTRRWGRLPARGDARGLSLAELLVSSAVLVLVLPLACTMLVRAVETERDLRGVTDAAAAAQVVVASVESGVRNAASLDRPTSGVAPPDEFLVARVATAVRNPVTNVVEDGPWRCVAWFYSADRDVLYTRTIPATGTTPAITPPSVTALGGWTTLAERVVPGPGATGVLVPSSDRSRVELSFSVGTGTQRPAATISTTVVRRPQSDTQGAPCFAQP